MMNGYSGKDLLEFLDYMLSKGLGKVDTLKSRRIACGRIFDVVGQDEVVDLRQIDVDHVMHRFQNLEGSKFSPGSLNTYKSRLRTSISDFLRYRENPSGFRAANQRTPRQPRKQPEVSAQSPSTPTEQPERMTSARGVETRQTLELPIPIRATHVVKIAGLPYDLTRNEAQRIANVVLAMAKLDE
jgi:hypothetical protein